MKIKSALKKRCEKCKIIRRKKKLYIFCTIFAKHKQKQG